jgi:hypothetical protein
MNSKVEWCMEWGSTLLLLLGVALTSFNIFPLNLWVCLAANAGWTVMGIIWKKWSLLVVQAVVSAIYIVGIVNHYWAL